GKGGCVIGTRTGFLDARIETQLAEVRAALAEVIEDV
ncbi:MAG: type III secretion system protein, partial [Sphaerobacter sp.]|nr:type III secretion system protein [Sphaerobacter sp.]